MGIRLQLILTAYFIIPGWALVQLHNPIPDQVITSNVNDAGRVRENTFNKMMKEELWTAQCRNRSKERNLYRGSNYADKDNEAVRIVQEINKPAPVKNLRFVRQISHELVDSRGVPRIRRTKKTKKDKKKKVRGRKPLNRRERWRKEKLRMRLEYNVTEHYSYETIPITTAKSQLSDYTIDDEAWNDDAKLRKFLETPYSIEDKVDKKYELSVLVDEDDGSLVEDNTVTWMEKVYSSNSPERLQRKSSHIISDSVVDQKRRNSRHRHSSAKDKDDEDDSHGSERNNKKHRHERPSRLSGDEMNYDQLRNNDKDIRGKDRIRSSSRPRLNRGKNQTDYGDKKDDETVTSDKNMKSKKRTGKYKKNSKDGRKIPSSGKSELTKKGAFWAKQLKLDISKGPKRVRNLISLDDLDT